MDGAACLATKRKVAGKADHTSMKVTTQRKRMKKNTPADVAGLIIGVPIGIAYVDPSHTTGVLVGAVKEKARVSSADQCEAEGNPISSADQSGGNLPAVEPTMIADEPQHEQRVAKLVFPVSAAQPGLEHQEELTNTILLDEEESTMAELGLPNPTVQGDFPISITSRVLSLGLLPDDVCPRLCDMLPLLDQDIGQLVHKAEPIRNIYKQIRGHLPAEIKNKLHAVAFIETYQPRVEDAQNRLEERVHQVRLIQNRETLDSQVADLDRKIRTLSNSRPEIVVGIDWMKRRRAELLAELRQLETDLPLEEKKLADLPSTIGGMERTKNTIAKKAQDIRREERLIPGSADADHRAIDEVDQLRVDVINATHSLGIV